MSRWATFETLCALLAPAASAPTEWPQEPGDWDWDALVALASEHLVTPALARPVARLATAPEDARRYFDTIHHLNARRNAIMLDATAAMVDGLREVGIEPLLLKGAASLVADLYDDPAERILGDIDLLVRPARVGAAATRLHALGYRRPPGSVRRWVQPAFAQHIAMLIQTETGVGVEIHKALVTTPYQPMLPTADVFARAHLIAWNGREVRVPCPTDRVIHNIVHDQLLHGRFARGGTQLRQLRELAHLVTRHAGAVDWPDVEKRFERAGHGNVLRGQAALCAALMRVTMPIGGENGAEAVCRLKASLMQSPTRLAGPPRLRRLMQIYATGLVADPRLALNLLNPLWWPKRIRGILDFLAGDRPK